MSVPQEVAKPFILMRMRQGIQIDVAIFYYLIGMLGMREIKMWEMWACGLVNEQVKTIFDSSVFDEMASEQALSSSTGTPARTGSRGLQYLIKGQSGTYSELFSTEVHMRLKIN
jgi:hypothetical protein